MLYICDNLTPNFENNFGDHSKNNITINSELWKNIKGKFYLELIDHADIDNIKDTLGLVPLTDYSIKENYNTLNYKCITIMTNKETTESIYWFFEHYYSSLIPYISIKSSSISNIDETMVD